MVFDFDVLSLPYFAMKYWCNEFISTDWAFFPLTTSFQRALRTFLSHWGINWPRLTTQQLNIYCPPLSQCHTNRCWNAAFVILGFAVTRETFILPASCSYDTGGSYRHNRSISPALWPGILCDDSTLLPWEAWMTLRVCGFLLTIGPSLMRDPFSRWETDHASRR